MKKLFIITGEYSGDIHASKVVSELKKIMPEIEIEAIGGQNLESQGVKLFSTQEKMSAMGLTPKIVINHLLLGKRVVDYLTKEYKPDLVLLVDYGTFNLNISKLLHKAGIKTYFYIPPQIWASRKWRLRTVKDNIDKVLTIFPFENKMYEEKGIKAEFVGHPLVDELPSFEKTDKEDFFEKHGFDKNKKLISVFPGSRAFELKFLFKRFVEAAKIIEKKKENVQFVISHAPNLKAAVFEKFLPKNCDYKIIKGENRKLLAFSDFLILASGTVALEAALYETPMLIAYRGPWFFYFVAMLVICTKYVSLPNVILDKFIFPELIQGNCNPKKIAQSALEIINSPSKYSQTKEDLKKVKTLLNSENSTLNAAKIIAEDI